MSRPATAPDPLTWLREAALRREAAGLRRDLWPRPAAGTGLVDLASNDYLGLARDPRVTDAAAAAARAWGGGSTGSRLVTGALDLHRELERALAAFTGSRGALLCSSGYLANLAAVTALSGAGSLVVSDATNHASIVDACRLSRARVEVTPHTDVGAVARALAGRTEDRALVVTDAVFSVAGDLAPLRDLHAVARRYGALLVVDEAHALGVLGGGGQGAVWAAGLAGEPDVVVTATLSKSLGAQGGVVLGADEVVAHLVNTARPFIFDTGLAPSCAGAALGALSVLRAEPDLPARARANALAVTRAAAEVGLTASAPAAAVAQVILGTPARALRAARTCADHGVHVACFRPPSVPDGESCLRITARADLTDDDLDLLAQALRAIAKDET